MRAKRWFRLIGYGFGLLALLALAPAARSDDMLFQDGLFHEFDGSCDNLTVRNTTGFWTNEPTSVEMVSPAEVTRDATLWDTSELTLSGGSIRESLYACGGSRLAVSGGSVRWALHARDSSQVTLSGGSVGALWAGDSSHVTFSDGSIDNYVAAHHSSQVTVSGGNVGSYLESQDSSQMTVSGGSIDGYLRADNNGHVAVLGGSIGGSLSANDTSQVTVSDGSIGGNIWAYDSSHITISGGTIDGTMGIYSTLTLVGSDFIIDGHPVGFGEYGTGGRDVVYAVLSGTLLNGEALTNDFALYGDGMLVLIPEPATLSLLAVGGLVLLRRYARQ